MIVHRSNGYRHGLFKKWKMVHLAFNDGEFSQAKDFHVGPFLEWRIRRWEAKCIREAELVKDWERDEI